MVIGHVDFGDVTWAWGFQECYLGMGFSRMLLAYGVFKNVTWAWGFQEWLTASVLGGLQSGGLQLGATVWATDLGAGDALTGPWGATIGGLQSGLQIWELATHSPVL